MALLAGWAFFFWLWQLFHAQYLLVDSHEYLFAAQNLFRHGAWYCAPWAEPLSPENFTKRPPGYPLILALLGRNYALVTFLQTAMAWLNIVLALLLVRRWTGKNPNPWVWLSMVVLFPAQFIYANLIMTETVFQLCLVGWVFFQDKALDEGATPAWRNSQVLMAFGALVKPVLYLAVFPAVLWGIFWAWKKKKWTWALWSALPLAVVLGYMGWNAHQTGYYHYSSIQGRSLLLYTSRFLLVQESGEVAADQYVDSVWQQVQATPDFGEGQKLLQKEVKLVIGSHLPAYISFHLKGMANFFADPGRFDLYHFFEVNPGEGGLLAQFSEGGYVAVWQYLWKQPVGWLLALAFIFAGNALKIGGMAIWTIRPAKPWWVWLLPLLPVFYLAGITGINGASRFFVPVYPLVLVMFLAADWPFGLQRLVRSRQ